MLRIVAVRRVRMVRMVRMVVVHVRMVVVLRSVVVPTNWGAAAVEFAVATFACGSFGVGVGGSDGGGLHEQGCADLSHRAAQLEEEQHGTLKKGGEHVATRDA